MACDVARPIQFIYFWFWQNAIFGQFRLVSLPFSRLQTDWTMAPDLQKCFPLPLFPFELFHFDYLLLFLDDHTVMSDGPTEAILNSKQTSHSDKQKKKNEGRKMTKWWWSNECENKKKLNALSYRMNSDESLHRLSILFCVLLSLGIECDLPTQKHCVVRRRERKWQNE